MGFKARKPTKVIGRWISTAEGWVPYEEHDPDKMQKAMIHWAMDPVDLVHVYRKQYLDDQPREAVVCGKGGDRIANVRIRVTVEAELLGDQYRAEDE